jgi:hypothetical protein
MAFSGSYAKERDRPVNGPSLGDESRNCTGRGRGGSSPVRTRVAPRTRRNRRHARATPRPATGLVLKSRHDGDFASHRRPRRTLAVDRLSILRRCRGAGASLPPRVRPQQCVNPRKLKVSGAPSCGAPQRIDRPINGDRRAKACPFRRRRGT